MNLPCYNASISIGGVSFLFDGSVAMCDPRLERDSCYRVNGSGEFQSTFIMGRDSYAALIRAITKWGPARLDPFYKHPKAKSRRKETMRP